jgi:hypothetical protein
MKVSFASPLRKGLASLGAMVLLGGGVASLALGSEARSASAKKSCSAVSRIERSARPKSVTVRLHCASPTLAGFRFDELDLRPNRPIRRVDASPQILGNTNDYSLECSLGPGEGRFKAVHCAGRLVPPFTVQLRLHLARGACRKPAFGINLFAGGGPDCQAPGVCPAGPAIGFRDKLGISSCSK